jgi:hypothetical protein
MMLGGALPYSYAPESHAPEPGRAFVVLAGQFIV